MTRIPALRPLARSLSSLFVLSLLAFSFVPAAAQVLEIVKDFEQTETYSMATLLRGSDGFLYGTTYKGGANNEGSIFKIAVDGTNFTLLKSFQCAVANNGCFPVAGLLQASDGFLYGATSLGGASDEGTLFKISTDGSNFTILKSFQCGTSPDGCSPQASLIQGSDGLLYGTTAFGGANDGGTLFKIAANGSGFIVLKTFQCGAAANSCHPAGALLQAKNQSLYGTTYHGGSNNQGSIFKIATDGSGFVLLKSFKCGVAADGCLPLAGLIQASDDLLYGTTQSGGEFDEGAIFKIGTDGSNFAVLKSFQCAQATTGCLPVGGVVPGADGNLYGTTTFGGANAEGALYKIGRNGTGFTILDRFACSNDEGCKPEASLTLANNGYFYGTSSAGGKYGGGAIYRLRAPDPSVTADLSATGASGPVPSNTIVKPTVAVAPTSVVRGAKVTIIWSSITNPAAKDWLGLYAAGTPAQAFRDWVYVSCSRTAGSARSSGSCDFAIPAVDNGVYEIRLLANDGFNVIATSAPLTIGGVSTPSSAQLSVAPAEVQRGASITVTWSGLPRTAAKDWVGLYLPGTPNTAYIAWAYVSCTTTASVPRVSGNCGLFVPQNTAPGTYEVRLLSNDGFEALATSNPFTVAPGSEAISAMPADVQRGDSIIVAWSGIRSPAAKDWIGLYVPGAGNNSFLTWVYVSCTTTATVSKASGNCAFKIPMVLTPGTYQLRLLSNDGFNLLATSGSVSVR